jgi:hypothetical protein
MEVAMTGRPRVFAPAQTFGGVTPLSQPGRGTYASAEPNASTPSQLLLPPRLIIPPSASVKRSLWAFRTPKLKLPND